MVPSPQCKARSTRTGERCKRHAINGAVVCQTHGGATRQVRFKAEERIASMVPAALTRIDELIHKADSDSVSLAASRDILDRAGHGVKNRNEVSGGLSIIVEYSDTPQYTPLLLPEPNPESDA